MALNAIHHRRYSGHPSGAPPAPIKAPDDPRSNSPLTELLSPPLPRWSTLPTEFPDNHRATVTPGRHTAARALVSHPPNSPRPTPPLPPLGRRPWTPERPEAKTPASSVPPSTAGPPWTEIPVVHGPVDPVYRISLTKLIH
jgi:hypothetical protein